MNPPRPPVPGPTPHPHAPYPQPHHPPPPPHPRPPYPHAYPAAPREAPHPSGTTSDERTYGMLAHLGFFVFPILAPALVFALASDKPHAKKCAAQAAALQLGIYGSFLVYPLMIVAMIFVSVGDSRSKPPDEGLLRLLMVAPWLLIGLAWALGILFTIWGAMQAHDGKVWRIPLFGGLVARMTGTR